MTGGPPRRLVAVGASNLTRCLPTFVGLARDAWGRETEVLAALGVGRSYGAWSRVLLRGLPGILESGLWRALEARPARETRALVTDVGNDILYGYEPAQILAWVEECVTRLLASTSDVVLTGLPVESLRRTSGAEFLLFRSILYPYCRLGRAEILDRAERISDGLLDLARRRRLRAVHLPGDWYGFDPVHFRPKLWGVACRHILLGDESAPGRGTSLFEKARLYAMRPERERFVGLERVSPQAGLVLAGGGRVWLY